MDSTPGLRFPTDGEDVSPLRSAQPGSEFRPVDIACKEAEAKNVWSYASTPPMSLNGVTLTLSIGAPSPFLLFRILQSLQYAVTGTKETARQKYEVRRTVGPARSFWQETTTQ
jgi:hypothetical protein